MGQLVLGADRCADLYANHKRYLAGDFGKIIDPEGDYCHYFGRTSRRKEPRSQAMNLPKDATQRMQMPCSPRIGMR
jgi:hypothetical protein